MTDQTPLDKAHEAMQAHPMDDTARLAFYHQLADAELFVLLTEEARDETLSPQVFPTEGGGIVLAFDREDRLALFTGAPAPFAALSGRVLAGLLAGQGMGLGLNLDVAPSSILIPTDALAWLTETLGSAPREVAANIDAFDTPVDLPDRLLAALTGKLSTAGGLATSAWLARVRYRGGAQGHLLGFVDARPDAQPALAKAAAEALTFSGIEAGALDVGFFAAGDAASLGMASVGLRIDLPQPEQHERTAPTAPGSDPEKPPILR